MNRIFYSLQVFGVVLCGAMAALPLRAQVQIEASPAAVAFSAQEGSATVVTQTIAIASSGDSTGANIDFFTFVDIFSGTGPWLNITSSSSGTTPGSITITANPSGMLDGVYTGRIQVYAANGATNSPLNVPVTLTISALTASPASLSFNYQLGGSIPLPQVVNVMGTGGSVMFTASGTVPSGIDFLQVSPASGTTTATVDVGLSPAIAGLAVGTYTGTVSLVPATGSMTPLDVPVTLTVSAAPVITASPANLNFVYQTTQMVPAAQTVAISATDGSVDMFMASASSMPSGTPWLAVMPLTGATPATLTVTVMPGSLPPGSYTGQITITVPGASDTVLNVTLTVSANPILSVAPSSLSFTYQTGNPLPASQQIATASTGAALAYTVATATANGGNWLSTSGASSTPTSVSVNVNPTGLLAGTYNGTVTLTANGAGNPPQQVAVTLMVTNFPTVQASPAALTFLYQTGQTVPAAQAVAVTTSLGVSLTYTVTAVAALGGRWLSVTPSSGTTDGSFMAAANVANLNPGTYTGTITITATNPAGGTVPNSPLAIPVTLYVSANPLLSAIPGALTFTAQQNAAATPQTIALTSTSDTLDYTVTAQTTSGSWLSVTPTPGTTPGSLTVSATAIGLTPGFYSGTITITATNPAGPSVDDSPVTVPVTFQVAIGTITATPASLAFTQTAGGAAPAPQSINVGGTPGLPFLVVASTANGATWLTATPSGSNTPGLLTVSVDSTGLSAGTYPGMVTISSPDAAGSPIKIPVTFTVGASSTISLTPASLSFTYQVGGTSPAAQTVAVAGSAGSPAFTVAATTNANSGNWLSATASAATAPANVSVAVNPTGLAAGTYTGTVTVTAPAAGNSPQTVAVTLVVTAAVLPVPLSVQNAASELPGAIAPGEIIAIYGTNLGPSAGAGPTIANNMLPTTIDGVSVTFDNIPAPLLYVSATQINAVAPFELNGRFQTEMQITNSGSVSSTLSLNVAAASPGIFTVSETGTGPGAIQNADLSLNTASNPAAPGSVIVLYATGGGETSPAGVDGNITPDDGTGLKLVPGVTVTVGNVPCTVLYAGSAPGFVEGGLQINAQLPADVPTGTQDVVVSVAGASSPTGVTVAIQ